jgi:hypothetical protein
MVFTIHHNNQRLSYTQDHDIEAKKPVPVAPLTRVPSGQTHLFALVLPPGLSESVLTHQLSEADEIYAHAADLPLGFNLFTCASSSGRSSASSEQWLPAVWLT